MENNRDNFRLHLRFNPNNSQHMRVYHFLDEHKNKRIAFVTKAILEFLENHPDEDINEIIKPLLSESPFLKKSNKSQKNSEKLKPKIKKENNKNEDTKFKTQQTLDNIEQKSLFDIKSSSVQSKKNNTDEMRKISINESEIIPDEVADDLLDSLDMFNQF